MRSKLLPILFCVFFTSFFYSQHHQHSSSHSKVVTPHVDPSVHLTENLGQWEDQVLFKAQLDGGACFLENNGLSFSFFDKKKYRAIHHGGLLKNKVTDLNLKFHAYRLRFENSNPKPLVEKNQIGTDYENFFIGNNPARWKSNVRNYHQVILRNVYEGIDYEVLTAVNGLKYNFLVQPHANPANIRIRYEGVENIKLVNGQLVLKLEVNEVIEQKPYAYQVIDGEVKEVACVYRFKSNVLSFDFPQGYNTDYPLVIDPLLVFAAQSGSLSDNFGMTATFDPQGNLYAGGTVFNNGYPTTSGAFSQVYTGQVTQGNTDVVITKYNSTGNSLLYSTYVGGSGAEIITSMIVDINNNLCFYGATGSFNFPMVAGAYDNTFNGGSNLSFFFNGTTFGNGTDIYVGKLNSGGTALLGTTYLGGSGNDGVNHVNHLTSIQIAQNPPVFVNEYYVDSLQYNYGDQYRGEIQLDVLNNIYIASSTRSSDFPTVNAYDNTLGGKQDAIVAKFNSNLTQLLFSTFIGGSENDCGNALIVNDQLEVYVTGGTCSPDFPVSAVANSTVYNGGKADGFIAHLNASGNGMLHATYVGTSSYDQCYFIQSDKYDNIFVYGQSLGNMPIVNAGTVVPYHNPGRHQFITRYRFDLSVKNMSMVFGSKLNDMDISPCAFAVDKCNNIYVSGWGSSILGATTPMSGMPLLQPTQSTTDGFDFYFMGLDSNAQALKYGSYFGGGFSQEHVDGGTSRFDPGGRIYQSACAGCGGFDDWPVTPGSWPNSPGNPNFSNNCNNGVVKLDFQLQTAVATINTNTLAGCAPLTVNFNNSTQPPGPSSTYTWNLGNGVVTSTSLNPSATYTAGGTYTVTLIVEDNLTCNKRDQTVTYITVQPKPTTNFTISGGQCSNTVSLQQSTSGNLGPNPYLWNFGNGAPTSTLSSPSYTYPGNGLYEVTLTVTDVNGCKDVKTNTIAILNFAPGAVSEATTCYGSVTTLTATGGTNYTWSPVSSLDNPNVAIPQASPTITTIYTVSILNNSYGLNCGKTLTTQVQVLPTPTTSFVYTVNPCGGNLYLKDQSIDDIVRWNWTLGPAKTSTVQNPVTFFKDGGTFTISLITTNSFGCKSKRDEVITVADPPDVNVNADQAICRGESAQLFAEGGIAYQWTPPQTLDIANIYNPVASPPVSTEYTVAITTSQVNAGKNCEFVLSTSVTVDVLSNVPIAATANPILITAGENSTLVYIGEPGATVNWLPPNSTKPTTGYTVTASPEQPTTYTAIASRGACASDVTVHIDSYSAGCFPKDAFIPNTFTPNGDGENDQFRVLGFKIDQVNLSIYNRWGEKVFETEDLSIGWDGKYKGKPVDVGVFGWYLKAKCVNGEETFIKGNVTLIR